MYYNIVLQPTCTCISSLLMCFYKNKYTNNNNINSNIIYYNVRVTYTCGQKGVLTSIPYYKQLVTYNRRIPNQMVIDQ